MKIHKKDKNHELRLLITNKCKKLSFSGEKHSDNYKQS